MTMLCVDVCKVNCTKLDLPLSFIASGFIHTGRHSQNLLKIQTLQKFSIKHFKWVLNTFVQDDSTICK